MNTGVQVNGLLILFLALYAAAIAVRLGLYALNTRHVRRFGREVPEGFSGVLDQETLERMQDYTLTTSRFGAIERLASNLLLLAILLSGLLPWLVQGISSLGAGFILSGVLFFFACFLILGAFEIPFDLYGTFGIEKRFSFSTITLSIWIADLVKSVIVSGLLMGVFLSVFFVLVSFAPRTWWLWSWLFFVFFQLLVSWLYPVVIAPIFNKFEPIDDEDLREGISSLAKRSGITVKGVYTMDALTRSTHSNAYFTGIGKSKRIVLFDTLLKGHTRDEVLAVLAHELGHWKLGHVRKQLMLSLVISLAVFYGAYLAATRELLYVTFGFSTVTVYAGLFILTILIKPAAFLLSPLGAMISRHFERQADDYAHDLVGSPDALVSALKGLATRNLSNLHPHPVYAWFSYSHPPLVERVGRLEAMGRPAGKISLPKP